MNDKQKRSLRPRKPYPYLPYDTEDLDQLRYGRINQNQEVISPAVELNSHAKILVKFFNSANKSYRQSQHMSNPIQSFKPNYESLQTPKNQYKSKRVENYKKGDKEETLKKKKEITSNKNYYQPSKYHNDQPLNQDRWNKQSQITKGLNEAFLTSFNKKNPQKTFHHMFAEGNNNQPKSIPQNQLKCRNGNHLMKEQIKQSSQKLFGRSAYHVAIAYHIHLEKIRNSGQSSIDSSSLDPTYCARKLKGNPNIRNTELQA